MLIKNEEHDQSLHCLSKIFLSCLSLLLVSLGGWQGLQCIHRLRPSAYRASGNPNTYFVRGRKNEAEMVRLLIQESYVTEGMGGPLSEQPDPQRLHHLLDVGCGPGGWAIEAARLYPGMHLVGIDINEGMISYACAQAQAQQFSTRVTFLVMDARRPLKFPDQTFDGVNMRLVASFLRVEDWPKLLQEFRRITRPGGMLRVTDGCTVQQTNSLACNRLGQMLLCAGYKAGHNLSAD